MGVYSKEIKKVKNILKGTFASSSDRQYWVNKLAEYEQYDKNAKNNAAFYKNYERGVAAFNEHKRRRK